MKMLLTAIIAANTAFASSTVTGEPEYGQVVVKRYKLAAMNGLMRNSLLNYKSQMYPAAKQCVLLSLGYEFSGEFLFFAQRGGTNQLEIVCFNPGAEDGEEWSGRLVKYEGDAKKQFEKIHKLLGELTSYPREKDEDLLRVLGGANFEIRVGDGDNIASAQPHGGFVSSHPQFKKTLLESIAIAASMAQLPLSDKFGEN